ncbi:MAG: toll/interleukin-1 receptor domain-containing protein [Anaerolineae bacterium]
MTDIEKTVFISYRRNVSAFIARAVFQDLNHNGYDVFMDVMSIDSGAFDTAILNQIAARAHFIVILTPGSVERCTRNDGTPNQEDWFRREIEYAIKTQRNVVPLLVNNFSFQDSEKFLNGNLSELARFNAVNVPHDYFDEAMLRIRTRFLKQPLQGKIISVPASEKPFVDERLNQAASQPAPTKEQLSAEVLFERAYGRAKNKDFDGAIKDYSQAVILNPDLGIAYFNRGLIYFENNAYLDAAIMDFSEAIRLDPEFIDAIYMRAISYYQKDDFLKAIEGYNEVLEQGAYMSEALNNRGECFFALGEYAKALPDFEQANKLRHGGFRMAIAGAAVTFHALGDIDKAKQLWRGLIKRSQRFTDIEWVSKELKWNDTLVNEAKLLLSKLS